MQIRPEEITQILKTQLTNFEKKLDVSETGTVVYAAANSAKTLLVWVGRDGAIAPVGLHRVLAQKFWMSCTLATVITVALMIASSVLLHLPWSRVVFFAFAIALMSAALSGLSLRDTIVRLRDAGLPLPPRGDLPDPPRMPNIGEAFPRPYQQADRIAADPAMRIPPRDPQGRHPHRRAPGAGPSGRGTGGARAWPCRPRVRHNVGRAAGCGRRARRAKDG